MSFLYQFFFILVFLLSFPFLKGEEGQCLTVNAQQVLSSKSSLRRLTVDEKRVLLLRVLRHKNRIQKSHFTQFASQIESSLETLKSYDPTQHQNFPWIIYVMKGSNQVLLDVRDFEVFKSVLSYTHSVLKATHSYLLNQWVQLKSHQLQEIVENFDLLEQWTLQYSSHTISSKDLARFKRLHQALYRFFAFYTAVSQINLDRMTFQITNNFLDYQERLFFLPHFYDSVFSQRKNLLETAIKEVVDQNFFSEKSLTNQDLVEKFQEQWFEMFEKMNKEGFSEGEQIAFPFYTTRPMNFEDTDILDAFFHFNAEVANEFVFIHSDWSDPYTALISHDYHFHGFNQNRSLFKARQRRPFLGVVNQQPKTIGLIEYQDFNLYLRASLNEVSSQIERKILKFAFFIMKHEQNILLLPSQDISRVKNKFNEELRETPVEQIGLPKILARTADHRVSSNPLDLYEMIKTLEIDQVELSHFLKRINYSDITHPELLRNIYQRTWAFYIKAKFSSSYEMSFSPEEFSYDRNHNIHIPILLLFLIEKHYFPFLEEKQMEFLAQE